MHLKHLAVSEFAVRNGLHGLTFAVVKTLEKQGKLSMKLSLKLIALLFGSILCSGYAAKEALNQMEKNKEEDSTPASSKVIDVETKK